MSELHEFAKLTFRLLDDINQTIEDGRDLESSISDVQGRIRTCAAGLHAEIRKHDAMASQEHKPERYSKLSQARPLDDCEKSLEQFFDEVKAARIRHQIPDVHIITKVNIETSGGESAAMGFAHFGAIQEAESMCSWAMGRAIEKRRDFIAHMSEQGIKHARSDQS